MAAHFEIVRSDSGWWARYVAANGQVVFVTETYTRKREAQRAIKRIVNASEIVEVDLRTPQQ